MFVIGREDIVKSDGLWRGIYDWWVGLKGYKDKGIKIISK